jgi:hypothetical protein
MINRKKMAYLGHVARMSDISNAYKLGKEAWGGQIN